MHEWKLAYTIKYKGKKVAKEHCEHCGEFREVKYKKPDKKQSIGFYQSDYR